MKVILLAPPDSSHTKKWALSLTKKGIEIIVFGLGNKSSKNYWIKQNIACYIFDINNLFFSRITRSKFLYLLALPYLLKTIWKEKPAILHAHFASSYGLLSKLTFFKKRIVSVWGSDVYDFPKNSKLNKAILKFALKNCKAILSTSKAMAKVTSNYTNKKIQITPFGINTKLFKNTNTPFKNEIITIGTIKTMHPNYGIDTLINAFGIVKKTLPETKLHLLIVGDGPNRNEYEDIASNIGIKENTTFLGFINQNDIHNAHNKIDIFVALSRFESFGVAMLEASSCERSILASKVGGISEVVEHNKTGYLIEPNDPIKAAEYLIKMIGNKKKSIAMGASGRNFVIDNYKLNYTVDLMINVYKGLE